MAESYNENTSFKLADGMSYTGPKLQENFKNMMKKFKMRASNHNSGEGGTKNVLDQYCCVNTL